MRKFIAAALAAGCLASAGISHADPREVTGTILLPTVRITQIPSVEVPVVGNPSASNGVYFRQARCAYVLAETATGNGNDGNGVAGYVVELSEEEGDGNHTFTATSSAGNVSVGFYEDLGTCENQPPSTPSPEPGGVFDTEGGEEGAIPFYAAYAIVVVEDANQVSFTFTTDSAA